MFRLRQKVGGYPRRIIVTVGDDQDLRRARNHIYSDNAEDAAFGRRDVRITGTNDLIDGNHAIGAVRQGCNRLCTANPDYVMDARNAGRGKNTITLDSPR